MVDIEELIKLEPYKSCYEYGESETTREVIDSLNQADYEYDSNMSIDMNIGSAMLKEYAKGYTTGYTDNHKETILKVRNLIGTIAENYVTKTSAMDMYWEILEGLKEL